VTVGAKDSLGYFSFAPAALAVSPETTVTWTWSGEGGGHNVVALDDTFASTLSDRSGATFSHTFTGRGVFKYYCGPHRGMGMKGAVVVLD
jgi:nitrite reductase (NO-forming)